MSDTIVAPFGSNTAAVPASAAIATFGSTEYQVFQTVGYPNEPNAEKVLFQGSGAYTSSAFTNATSVRVAPGSTPVSYNVGASAVAGVTHGFPAQNAPGTLNATGTLTAALILGQIVTSSTAAAVAGTLDTGATMDAAVSMNIGDWFDWSVINTGASNAFTVTASSGHTIVGAGAVALSTSGRFRTRKTAAATFVTYRV